MMMIDPSIQRPETVARRSDADLAASARNILRWTHLMPVAALDVQVERGWLTLSGEVDWLHQRHDAAASLARLPGMTGISNHVAVRPSLSVTVVRFAAEAARQRQSADVSA